jgi:hypothetical protein
MPVAERQLVELRKGVQRASAHPLIPADARTAIANLLGVVEALAFAIDSLRADLARLRCRDSDPSSSSAPH